MASFEQINNMLLCTLILYTYNLHTLRYAISNSIDAFFILQQIICFFGQNTKCFDISVLSFITLLLDEKRNSSLLKSEILSCLTISRPGITSDLLIIKDSSVSLILINTEKKNQLLEFRLIYDLLIMTYMACVLDSYWKVFALHMMVNCEFR